MVHWDSVIKMLGNSTNLLSNPTVQSVGATPSLTTSSSRNASICPMPSTNHMHATGGQSLNLQSLTYPVPVRKDEALQKAIQYVASLSGEDKAAFKSAPNIIERLQEIQGKNKSLICSLTPRVERVLQCVRTFIGSLAIFIQQNPEISSLVVGGVNCVLTVGTYSSLFI